MTPNQALWEKGDFTRLAALMRQSGEAIVESLAIRPPLRALDLGCGDGTTAVPLAQAGAQVLGIDIARNLVDAGQHRAAELAVADQLQFQHGDAAELEGVADDSFDLALSMFGAMFSPRPFEVARELVRVVKSGGQIVMGNWIPNDPTSFVSQLLKISAAFTPPPPEGFVSPVLWGVEAHIVERFGQAGVPAERITMARDTYWFHADRLSPADLIGLFRDWYGPTMNAYAAAAQNGRADELQGQLVALAEAQNQGRGEAIAIPATFMRVTVQT